MCHTHYATTENVVDGFPCCNRALGRNDTLTSDPFLVTCPDCKRTDKFRQDEDWELCDVVTD